MSEWFVSLVKLTFPALLSSGWWLTVYIFIILNFSSLYFHHFCRCFELTKNVKTYEDLSVLGCRGAAVLIFSSMISRWTFEALCHYNHDRDAQFCRTTFLPHQFLITLVARVLNMKRDGTELEQPQQPRQPQVQQQHQQ